MSVRVGYNLVSFDLLEGGPGAHSSMSNILRFVVKGHVQGVGFRWATREQALQRGICGWVQNCSDGSVEILAKGAENSLSSLEDWLWHGPSESRVSEILVTPEEKEPVPDTFYIR